MKKYVIEFTHKSGKKAYGKMLDTREEAESQKRSWLRLCGGKCPFDMKILELEKEQEK